MKIKDEAEAFDLDNAVSLRLLKFDNEVREADAKRIAHEVWGGDKAAKDEAVDDPTVEKW